MEYNPRKKIKQPRWRWLVALVWLQEQLRQVMLMAFEHLRVHCSKTFDPRYCYYSTSANSRLNAHVFSGDVFKDHLHHVLQCFYCSVLLV